MELLTGDGPTEHTERVMKTEKGKLAIWVTLEAVEVIVLKRIILDQEVAEVVDFFKTMIVPQVSAAAERRGIYRMDIKVTDGGRLPG
jgi:hypothetical protein